MEGTALIWSLLTRKPGGRLPRETRGCERTAAGRGRRSLAAARGGCGSRTRAWLCAGFLAGVVLTAAAARAEDDPAATGSENALAAGTGPGKAETLKRSRLEFDERLIMGQSLKSGAIYLFDRKDSQIQSMVKIRKDFREELLSPLEPSP